MLTVGKSALEQLAALLLERAGLRVSADGFNGLKLALNERMPALGISDADDYVRRLRERQGEHELRALLPLVTVTHTEFFRDPRQFRALEQRVVPEALARSRRAGRKVSIWSAGCATGEEPYSLAMLLAELGASKNEVDLWATDLNQSAVASAKLGRYPLRRMNPVGRDRMSKYFRPTEDGYEVQPELREWVHFDGLNLAAPIFAKVQPATFDVILCRNVIIYFDLPTIRGLMDRFYAALRPGAFLILGYSESLFRVYDRFEMVEVEGAFLYRRPRTESAHRSPQTVVEKLGASVELPPRRHSGEFAVVVPAKTAGPAIAAAPPPPVTRARAESPPRMTGEFRVVVAAQVASDAGKTAPFAPSAGLRAPAERLADAAKLVQTGAFDEALQTLRELQTAEPEDLATQLTLGNVYSVMGRAEEAARVFAEVSLREPLCVEARLFGSMAAMQVGRDDEARGQVQKALFLEPTLALAHYLAAQIFERLGDHDGARRSYRNAITQLRFPQRVLAGYYPDLPDSPELISRAARYALAALEEAPSAVR